MWEPGLQVAGEGLGSSLAGRGHHRGCQSPRGREGGRNAQGSEVNGPTGSSLETQADLEKEQSHMGGRAGNQGDS